MFWAWSKRAGPSLNRSNGGWERGWDIGRSRRVVKVWKRPVLRHEERRDAGKVRREHRSLQVEASTGMGATRKWGQSRRMAV